MKVTPREYTSTCSECRTTHHGIFVVVVGEVTLSLCRECAKRLGMLIVRAERRALYA